MNDSDGAEVERILEQLITQYGLNQVKADLAKLWPRSRWEDYQRSYNIAEDVARRIERTEKQIQ